MSSMRFSLFRVLAASALACAAGCAPEAGKARGASPSEQTSHAEVRALLDAQAAAWNRHDLDGFLAGYRKDEHVVFVTKEGSTRGFAELEQRYRKSYNAPEKFGELKFENIECQSVDADSVVVHGTWRLLGLPNTPHGRFVLVVLRLKEGWRIVSDYTTSES
jgi:ketosteroid isomerase-like protein